MKNMTCSLLLSLLSLSVAPIVNAATVPTMEVTVSDSSGKVAHKGTTSADGSFSTGQLAPGNYVVLFNAKSAGAKGAKFRLAVAAGKNNFSADSVAGEKIAADGVAMKVAVSAPAKISGQVADAATAPAATAKANTSATAKAGTQSTQPVKIINGKRYVWVRPNSGLEGGHWEEEGSAAKPQTTGVQPQSSQAPRQPGAMRGY
jgi:hypothetical protein